MKLNKKIDALTESATLRLNAEAKALRAAGVKVFNLTVGELDFETPEVLKRGVRKHLKKNKYTPTNGELELRSAIASDVSTRYGFPVTAAEVAVTAGAKQALFNIFQIICNSGDEVIIPTPGWVSYEHQVMLAGAKPVFVPLTKSFDLDVPAIARLLTKKTKAIILNSPHNPTGTVFSERSLRALVKLVDDKDVFIIADDIYNTLLYTDTYTPVSTFLKKKDHLIIVNGFSKSHAITGWRIGYMVAAPAIIDANNRLQSHSSGNASALSQWAVLESLQHSDTPQFLAVLQKRKKLVEKKLTRITPLSFHSPLGAFYFFVDVRKVDSDSVRFCERLLKEEGVAVVPGEAFRSPGFFRLSFACDEHDLAEALDRITRFVKHYKNT